MSTDNRLRDKWLKPLNYDQQCIKFFVYTR
jgi:hypothetical protein